ncbi:MAG: cytochrome c biogenesis protein ResB [Phycisphaerales bacterium]
MTRFRRAALWAVLAAIILLTVLSIYGAFIGAERAQAFFSSMPLAVFWFAAVALLVLGVVLFPRLLRVPSLLLMHLGCILVLLGMMWGSKPGHTLQSRLFGIDKIPIAEMDLHEQTQSSRVWTDSNDVRELPFSVRLNAFRIEYYKPGRLYVWSRDGRSWRMPAEAGQTLSLGEGLGVLTITRVFQNFKIDLRGQETTVFDQPGGSNPAVEVTIEKPGAPPGKRYVFEDRPGHGSPNDPLVMAYFRTPKDFISELEIVKDGEVVAAKDIEVNHPLYYGGYHFYQKDCLKDDFGRLVSRIMVVSDSGLNVIYGGYVLLTGGIFWHFWGRRILNRIKTRPTPPEESR